MKNRYYIKAVQQILHPSLRIIIELKNDYDLSLTLDVRQVEKNQVLMDALSKKEVESIKFYASLVSKEPITE